MDHKLTAELVVYPGPGDERRVSFLRLDGHCEVDFVKYLIDPDTESLVIEELETTQIDLPDGVACYQALLYYSYDEGDHSVGIWPGWTFGFDPDVIKQIHPKEEQYYLPEPEFEPPQDWDDGHEVEFYDGHWSDEEDYEFRKWIPGKSAQEPLFKNKETK